MRLLDLLPLALTALSLIPISISVATGTNLIGRGDSNTIDTRSPGPVPPCRHLVTRDDWTCHCLAGFVGPSDGDIEKECHCGDKENSGYGQYTDPVGLVIPYCYCRGEYQLYDTDKHKCECDDKCYSKTKSNGHLVCTLKTSTPTGGLGKRSLITLEKALQARESGEEADINVEEVLGCSEEQKACRVDGSWRCTNVMSDLATCGGCPGEAIDCASLTGVNEVRCEEGKCAIDSCTAGFALTHGPTPTNHSAPHTYCAPKHHTPLFEAQHPAM